MRWTDARLDALESTIERFGDEVHCGPAMLRELIAEARYAQASRKAVERVLDLWHKGYGHAYPHDSGCELCSALSDLERAVKAVSEALMA